MKIGYYIGTLFALIILAGSYTPELILLNPYAVFCPVVILSTWFGRWRWGLAAFIGSSGVRLFLYHAYGQQLINATAAYGGVVLFLFTSVILIMLVESRHNESTRAASAVQRVWEAENTLRLILEGTASHALLQLDRSGIILRVNAGVTQITGYAPDDLIGENFRVLYTEEERVLRGRRPEEELHQAETLGRINDERWLVTKDNRRVYTKGVTTAVTNSQGALEGFVKLFEDKTATQKYVTDLQVQAMGAAVVLGEGEPPAQGKKVLVVEDNPEAAIMLSELLYTVAGHEVRVAYTGGETMDALRDFTPDVVLCDIGLPDMTGYELLRFMKEKQQLAQTRFVALSGFGHPEDIRRSQAEGFALHVVKPPTIEALDEAINGSEGAAVK